MATQASAVACTPARGSHSIAEACLLQVAVMPWGLSRPPHGPHPQPLAHAAATAGALCRLQRRHAGARLGVDWAAGASSFAQLRYDVYTEASYEVIWRDYAYQQPLSWWFPQDFGKLNLSLAGWNDNREVHQAVSVAAAPRAAPAQGCPRAHGWWQGLGVGEQAGGGLGTGAPMLQPSLEAACDAPTPPPACVVWVR